MHHPGKIFHSYWTSCSGPQYFSPWFCVPNLTLRMPQSWCDWAQRTPSCGWDTRVTHSIRWWVHFSYGSISSESWWYFCFVWLFFSFYFFVFKNNLSLLCFPLLLFTLAYWQSKLKALYPISFSSIFSWKSLGVSLAVPLLSLTCLMLSIVSGLTVWYGHAPLPPVTVVLIRSANLQATTFFPSEMHSILSQKPIIPVSQAIVQKTNLHSLNPSLHLQLCWLQPPPHLATRDPWPLS